MHQTDSPSYRLDYAPIKRMSLRLDATGQVWVKAPKGTSKRRIDHFVAQQSEWIARQTVRFEAAKRAVSVPANHTLLWGSAYRWHESSTARGLSLEYSVFSDAASLRSTDTPRLITPINWAALPAEKQSQHYKALAKTQLLPRLEQLAQQHGFTYNNVSIRQQKSRWGSCSSQKNLSLNWRIMQLPPEVADYVLLHELCHTEHMNHSARFWQRVASVCPQYHTAEQWLSDIGWILLKAP